jgi:hypothetical protein
VTIPLVLADAAEITPKKPLRRLAVATTFDRKAVLSPEQLLARAGELLERAEVPEERHAIVLDAQLRDERLAGVLQLLEKERALPVLALEAQSGLRDRPSLASLDREESKLAIADTEATLRRASSVGAPHVVLRLGWVEGARRDWVYVRERFLRGQALRVRDIHQARDHVAARHVDRARAALDRLCRVADSMGITLLVKNGQRYVELPSPAEWRGLVVELQGGPIRPLFDLPAALLPSQMGFYPIDVVAATFGGGPLGYAGDACGAVAALPPGHGDLGLRTLDAESIAFRPWPQLTDEEITLALKKLR